MSNVLLIGKLKKPYINVHFFLKIFDKEKDISYNIKAFISAPLAQPDRATNNAIFKTAQSDLINMHH